MARYLTEEQAAADGFRIEHEPSAQRYALYLDATGQDTDAPDSAAPSEPQLVGEAHYSLIGDDTDGIINFDHTVVLPALRGNGLSMLLARRALDKNSGAGEAIGHRRVHASCWFIARVIARHPELLE